MWNSAPPITGTPIATTGATTLNTWTEINVTAAVTANGSVSFANLPNSINGATWSSKEDLNPPQLVVTYG